MPMYTFKVLVDGAPLIDESYYLDSELRALEYIESKVKRIRRFYER